MNPYVRVLRHYVRVQFLIASLIDAILALCAIHLAVWLENAVGPGSSTHVELESAVLYALVVTLSMAAMGVHESHVREGYTGAVLRAAVAIFLIATIFSASLFYVIPTLALKSQLLAIGAVLTFVLVGITRTFEIGVLDAEFFRRKVVVLGCGQRAAKLASRLRRRYDQRTFNIVAYLCRCPDEEDHVSHYGAPKALLQETILSYCARCNIDEIVVALDERRGSRGQDKKGMPIDELLECRFAGMQVTDIQSFVERETGKLDTDLLERSWMIFSDGFTQSAWRRASKRAFDMFAGIALLAVAWPVMIVLVLAIWIEGGFRGPIMYRQQRVGLSGRTFEVLKFRTMVRNAEDAGIARWAEAKDPRTTRVGRFMRRTRLDELPQIVNVLRGEMSFVGPRPERPQFVDQLSETIPYYSYRHAIKPGITGWAQLCYPYGSSSEDAREKLKFDLYYLKNHSILLDLIILFQTIDVVLVGEGAR